MCTAIAFMQKHNFFGRTLDLEYHYKEEIVITPAGYHFCFRHEGDFTTESAIIGVATVIDSYPLYYDAINEHGLAMAGLNFVGNAKFMSNRAGYVNLAQFELIPYILGRARSIYQAKELLNDVRLINTPYSDTTPVSELHFFLTDGNISLAAEPEKDGFRIYNDPFGVLANNPPFPYHRENINNYMGLTRSEAENRFSKKLPLYNYSRGMGAIGLPGDLSSSSRFVRAAFAVANAAKLDTDTDAVGQVFHILDTVKQTEGLVSVGDKYEKTQYSVCADLNTGTYYYKTYSNSRINAVRLTEVSKTKSTLSRFPMELAEDICFIN